MQALSLNEEIKAMAEELKDEQSCLVFGRGRNYATAMEAALKVGRLEPSECRVKFWPGAVLPLFWLRYRNALLLA